MREEQEKTEHRLAGLHDGKRKRTQIRQCREEYARRFDNALHTHPAGHQWLGREEIADVVAKSLAFGDGRRYNLLAHCIMPNHGHALLGLGDWLSMLGMEERKTNISHLASEGEATLTEVMASFKRYTALRANRILGRCGPFWQDESYDHLVRDGEELEHAVRYIIMNPVRAGLCDNWQDWPWTYCAPWLVELL
jgi:REP element-mobilizing transposase RayT